MNIVTGEKIQFLCDHYVGTFYDFNYNPQIACRYSFHVYIDRIKAPFDNKRHVYSYTHNLPVLKECLKWFTNPFVLVLGNSDYNFDQKHLDLFELPNLIRIITQNMNVVHEKVFPLPIGLANSMWPHGNPQMLINSMNGEKTKNVYFYFGIGTNPPKRNECFQKISAKGLTFNGTSHFGAYVEDLGKHKFAICPEGNGIDTHRFWECLYLKVVPICKKNILVTYLANYFPIILLDDWDDLDITRLDYSQYKWENWKDLDLEYYKDLMYK